MTKKKLLIFGVCTSILVLCIYLYFTMINFDEEIDTSLIKNDIGNNDDSPSDIFSSNLIMAGYEDLFVGYEDLFVGYLDSVPGSDEDGDGVLAPFDVCPRLPSIQKLYGCPIDGVIVFGAIDVDRDGIVHSVDLCPRTPGDADNDGCPAGSKFDTDGDGFLDQDDSCPGFFGIKEYGGCQIDIQGIVYDSSIYYTADYGSLIIRNLDIYGYPFVYDRGRCLLDPLAGCRHGQNTEYGWDAHAFHEMIKYIEYRKAVGYYGYIDLSGYVDPRP